MKAQLEASNKKIAEQSTAQTEYDNTIKELKIQLQTFKESKQVVTVQEDSLHANSRLSDLTKRNTELEKESRELTSELNVIQRDKDKLRQAV